MRTVILSLEESGDVDSTAAEALIEFARQMQAEGRALILARIKHELRERLLLAGAGAIADRSRCFRSVADAVAAVSGGAAVD